MVLLRRPGVVVYTRGDVFADGTYFVDELNIRETMFVLGNRKRCSYDERDVRAS